MVQDVKIVYKRDIIGLLITKELRVGTKVANRSTVKARKIIKVQIFNGYNVYLHDGKQAFNLHNLSDDKKENLETAKELATFLGVELEIVNNA